MIICEVNKNHLNVRTKELLTAGSQNVNTVEFRFNAAWDGLAKTATFKTSKKTISVLLNTNTTAIPWEVLADAGEILAVGVFGVSGETIVLPTVWGILGKVMDAAHLGDEEKEPTPDVYQKILDELNALERPTWEMVQNKPFSTLGGGLSVDENGVLSAEGGGSANAVQYVAQTLTNEQKAQARENIGAGTSSFSGSYNDLTSKPTIPTQVTIDSTLKQSGQAADAKAVGDALQNYVTGDEWENILPQFEQALGTIAQDIGTKLDKNQGAGNAGKILGIGEDGIVVPQDNPTYTLPQATADALGGIKADAATAEDTQVVRIGTDGKLRTKPTGGSSITVDSALSSTSTNPVQNKVVTAALAEKITAPTTAAVGQIIKVKSVDDAGKPTEWEATDLPSGGGGETWTLIKDITLGEDVTSIEEQNLNLKKLYLTMAIIGTSQNTSSKNGELQINDETYYYSNNIDATEGLKRWLTSYVELIGDVKRHVSTSNNNSPFQSNVTQSGYFGDGTVINALKIIPFKVAGKYIGAGTRVKIYGISA